MPDRRGPVRIGTVLTLPGVTVAELLAEPFDFVWVDLEHGALGELEAQEMIIGAQASGTAALVRLRADADRMTTMLDAGADGVVLADVREVAAAEAAVERMAHPPRGTRGWGPRRSSLRRRSGTGQAPEPKLSVQIESVEGVEGAAAIAAVAGIEALVVGTADLSFSLGVPLDMASSDLAAAIEVVRAAAHAAGVAFGLAGAIDGLPPNALAGVDQLVHSTDARISAGAVDAAVEAMRARLAEVDDCKGSGADVDGLPDDRQAERSG